MKRRELIKIQTLCPPRIATFLHIASRSAQASGFRGFFHHVRFGHTGALEAAACRVALFVNRGGRRLGTGTKRIMTESATRLNSGFVPHKIL